MPTTMPASATAKTLPQHQRKNAAALRAQRLPDGDLPRALDHRVGDDAVQAQHREQRGGDGKCAEKREHQASLIFRGVEDGGERLDFRDGLVVIELQDCTAHDVGEGRWIALGADHQYGGLRRLLRIRHIEARHGIGVPALLMHRCGDADDLEWLLVGADEQVLADGVFAARILRPEAAREALVNDGDAGCAGVVCDGEGATAVQRDLESAEVVGRDLLDDRDGSLVQQQLRTSSDPDRCAGPARGGEREGDARVFDTGNRFDPVDKLGVEAGALCVGVVLRWARARPTW